MRKIVLACALAATTGGAFAQQAYIGASYGITQTSVDCDLTSSCDKNDAGIKLYGGYQLNSVWSVEVGYIDFGKAKASAVVSGSNVEATFKVNAVTLAAAARASLAPELAGVLRLGVANVDTKITRDVAGFGSGSESETKAKPYFGLGLEYSFSKMLRGTVSADFSQGEVDGEKGDVRAIMLGVQYGF